jgi:hypothetical protein
MGRRSRHGAHLQQPDALAAHVALLPVALHLPPALPQPLALDLRQLGVLLQLGHHQLGPLLVEAGLRGGGGEGGGGGGLRGTGGQFWWGGQGAAGGTWGAGQGGAGWRGAGSSASRAAPTCSTLHIVYTSLPGGL